MKQGADNWILALNDVAVGYGSRVVLGGVNFQVQRGSFVGLLGSNGSGKTTLLKSILGIQKPLAGEIQFFEQHGRPPVIGYVPQRESLDPIYLLSAFEVVMMGTYGRVGAGQFVTAKEREWVNECVRVTGAAEFQNRRFSELSGGQKQRALIARALVTRPDILVLDEPTAGIDPGAAKAICELLDRLHRGGLTVLMVNHELQIVRNLAQHVIWLQHGRVTQGPVETMLSAERVEQILQLKFG